MSVYKHTIIALATTFQQIKQYSAKQNELLKDLFIILLNIYLFDEKNTYSLEYKSSQPKHFPHLYTF